MNNLTLATIFVVLSEVIVWLTLYVLACRRAERLAFGKLRVKLFRYLLTRTGNIRYRLLYARILFGPSPLADWADRRIASDRELEHRVRLALDRTNSLATDCIAVTDCHPCKAKLFDNLRRRTLRDCITRNETTVPLTFDVGGEG